jgi:N-acetylglucosamine-6-phosphate deacetylase
MTILTGPKVVTPQGIFEHGWVDVDGDRITEVGDGLAGQQDVVVVEGEWLLPGFVDLHVHGGGGHDVTASPAQLKAAVDFHRRHGTTRTLVSLVTASEADLAVQLGWIADLAGDQVVGAHLEGPFLAGGHCGAQNPSFLLLPQSRAFGNLVAAARGHLRSITIAPELPGAVELIEAAVAAGIVVGLGHSGATYDQALAGVAAGATLATHLFNAMPPLHHRDPGLVGAALDSGLACEVINDGAHVHPSIVGLVADDPHRLVLITDAIDAAGAGDGEYVLGGQPVLVNDGKARLVSNGALAGSTLTMDEALRRAVQDSGLSLQAASLAASGNPARVLGLAHRCGAIAPGLDADLVVLDSDLRVRRVMKSGRWVHTEPLASATRTTWSAAPALSRYQRRS